MTLYADSSAILKLYLDEPDTDTAREILRDDPAWLSACITAVEVGRNLARLLTGADLAVAREAFAQDWSDTVSLAIHDSSCRRAVVLAEETGVRTLDALHLEAAERAAPKRDIPVVTFDRPLADAARSLGWTVLGA